MGGWSIGALPRCPLLRLDSLSFSLSDPPPPNSRQQTHTLCTVVFIAFVGRRLPPSLTTQPNPIKAAPLLSLPLRLLLLFFFSFLFFFLSSYSSTSLHSSFFLFLPVSSPVHLAQLNERHEKKTFQPLLLFSCHPQPPSTNRKNNNQTATNQQVIRTTHPPPPTPLQPNITELNQ